METAPVETPPVVAEAVPQAEVAAAAPGEGWWSQWWSSAPEAYDNDVALFDGVRHLAEGPRAAVLDEAAVAYHARRAVTHRDAHAALALGDALVKRRV